VTEIRTYPDPASLATAAAERFLTLATLAIARRGQFSVALAGGSSPKAMYALLATEESARRVDWSLVHLFWGDERCVPPDHPGSNYRMTRETLIDHVPLPAGNIHRMAGEIEPEDAARAYSTNLKSFFGGAWPSFDLVLLGLGQDGHTASLFPGSAVLYERARLAVAVTAHYQDRPAYRVTLTPPAINAARQVLFLAAGAAKAEIVRAVLQGPAGQYPAQLIQPATGRLTWMLDAPAASQLQKRA
jgi:6-phosphogluconolactonase